MTRLRLIMAGRRPTYIVVALMAMGLGAMVIMPLLGVINRPALRLPTNEIRATQYVAPYVIPTDSTPRTARFTVLEPEFDYTFSRRMKRRQSIAAPAQNTTAPQLVTFGNSITTPTGGAMKLIAAGSGQNLNIGAMWKTQQDEAVYGPDLMPMSSGDRARFTTEVGGEKALFDLTRVVWHGFYMGGATVVMEETGEVTGKPPRFFARDARTGWDITSRQSSTWVSAVGEGPAQRRFRSFSFPVNCAGTGPVDLWFEWRGEKTETPIPMKAGWTGELAGVSVDLRAIMWYRDGVRSFESVDGEATEDQTRIQFPRGGNQAFFEFKDLPLNTFDLVGFTANPQRPRVPCTMRYTSADSVRFVLESGEDELTGIALIHEGVGERAVMQLPFVPGLDEGNRNLEDFTDARIPVSVFGDVKALGMFLEGALQLKNATPYLASATTGYPMNCKPMSVGELWEIYRGDLTRPTIRVELDPDAGVSTMSFEAPRSTLFNVYPLRALILRMLVPGGVLLLLLAGMISVLKLATMLMGLKLQRELRVKGFADVTVFEAEELWLRMLWSARKVPRYEELAAVPGVDVGHMASIAAFMEAQRKDRMT